MNDIKKQRNRYLTEGIAMIALLCNVLVVINQFCDVPDLLIPACISGSYALLVVVAAGLVWGKVARNTENIPNYHIGVSTIRLLLALAIIFTYIFCSDSSERLPFFLVFAAFYLLLLVHHSLFHTRLNKQQKNETH